MKVLVYKDSQILDLQWLPKLNFGNNEVTITERIEEYIPAVADKKFAFTTHRLHCDMSAESPAYVGFEEKVIALSDASDLLFTFESELHNYHWEMWSRCHRNNVYWVVPGQVNDSSMNDHLVFWGDWFKTTTEVYHALPHKLAEINSYATKPMMFDALLGSPKPHRDFVFENVQKYGLQNKFIMPYGGKWNDNEFYAKDYFIWEPDIEVIGEQQAGTAGPVRYCGVWTGLSRVIPIRVFNETAYSIVAETDHDNTLSFFSEKTAKPMVARRLFVAFTGYKFLENLRRQGFQTLNGIIDESYDQVKDDTLRYTMAFDQVRKLCDMNQQEVYEQARPILEHNFNHIMSTDWIEFGCRKIQSLLDTKLAQDS